MKGRSFDLEDRLLTLAVRIIRLTETLSRASVAGHIRDQLSRSGTSAASNYGEAQSAESSRGFIHKLRIILKELRETRIWLLIIRRVDLTEAHSEVDALVSETNELISIFMASVRTASQRLA